MAKSLAVVIALSIATVGFGSGKLPLHPHLPPLPKPIANGTKEPVKPRTVLTCFPGYELIDGSCTKQVDQPATVVCEGGSLTPEGCQITVPYLGECPIGYKFKDEQCFRTIEVGIQYYCPKGFYDDGATCSQSVPSESSLTCDLGDLVGDRCVFTQRTEHLMKAECPEGSKVEEDGNCWKVVDTFDCTEPLPPAQRIVSKPKQPTSTGKKVLVTKGRHLRMLFGKDAQSPPREELPPPKRPEIKGCPKEMIAVSNPRPTKIAVESKICSRRIQVDAMAIILCPTDYIDAGEFCLKETITVPVSQCGGGRGKDGTCTPTVKRVPKYPGCPQDSFSARGKCWKEDILPPKQSCARGYIDNGEACIGLLEAPAFECPADLELIEDRCIGELKRAPITLVLEPEGSEGCATTKL